MKILIQTITVVLLLASSAMAGRLPPEEVPSITTDEAVFSVPHFSFKGERSQNGGYLEAHHPETKKLLWRVQIYKIIYNENLEGDVQDIFIKSLSFDKSHNLLLMSDEKGRVFILNLKTKKVTQIE